MTWCRTDGSKTDHHPRCEYVDASLIDVWRVTFDGAFYFQDTEPTPDQLAHGEIVTKEKMHREIYENLPEFAGF